jgi:hypothetical protein
MKDKCEPHFSLPFMVGGCDRAFLERCLQDYQAVASYNFNKDRQLQTDSFMKAVTIYINKHLSPLHIHPIQAVRLMLLEKYYPLGEKWCKPGAHSHSSNRSKGCFGFRLPFVFPSATAKGKFTVTICSKLARTSFQPVAVSQVSIRCLNHPS